MTVANVTSPYDCSINREHPKSDHHCWSNVSIVNKLYLSLSLSLCVVFLWVRTCLFITLIRCLEGLKTMILFFICQLVKSNSQWVSESVTRSPIELFWTAKKINHNFHIRMYVCRIYLSIIESIEITHFLVLSMTWWTVQASIFCSVIWRINKNRFVK